MAATQSLHNVSHYSSRLGRHANVSNYESNDKLRDLAKIYLDIRPHQAESEKKDNLRYLGQQEEHTDDFNS